MQHKFKYMDGGVERAIVWDEAEPDRFGIYAQADLSGLAALNRAQGEHERARHMTTTLARVPFTVWEKAHQEGWEQKDWDRFLNDPDNADFRVWRGRL